MGHKPKQFYYAGHSVLRATLAVLAIWCVQASAANSGICDQSSRNDTAIDMNFHVEVADLGTDGSVVTRRPDLLSADEPSLPSAVTPQRFETSSRVTELLRRIFEEAAADQFSLDEDQNPVRAVSEESGTRNDRPDEPAAELKLADPVSEEAREELQSAPEAAVEFPGVSDEEYSRYRRQMYRTDI